MAKRVTDHYQKASEHLARAAEHEKKAAQDHEAGRDEAAIQHAQTARVHTLRAESHAERALNAYVEHVHVLMGEVRHRAKNTLNLVQAIAQQTAAGSPETFIARFNDRIRALASYQDLLVRSERNGVELDELVRAQLAHLTDQIGSRIITHGVARQRLNAAAAQVIGLALNELATNAVKYGALSTAAGRVEIGWGVDGGVLEIAWTERNGPPVKPPHRRGFGTTIMTSLPKMTIDGQAQLDFAPSGVSWRLTCSTADVLLPEKAAAKPERGGVASIILESHPGVVAAATAVLRYLSFALPLASTPSVDLDAVTYSGVSAWFGPHKRTRKAGGGLRGSYQSRRRGAGLAQLLATPR
jgi:two-component sensor histidine kinase